MIRLNIQFYYLAFKPTTVCTQILLYQLLLLILDTYISEPKLYGIGNAIKRAIIYQIYSWFFFLFSYGDNQLGKHHE